MKEETIKSARIIFNGYLKLDDYYDYLHKIFVWLGYLVDEVLYRHKESADGKREIELFWDCKKDVDSYTRLRISVNLFVGGLMKVEVVKDGEKLRMDKCEVDLKLKAKIVKDYRNFFENPFLKPFKYLYEMVWYKATLDSWKSKIEDDLLRIESEMKAFLNLQGIRVK